MIDVLILTQEDCANCDSARDILERLAAEHPLSVHHCDLASQQGRALAESHGVMFAPGVLVDGALFSYGRLSERKLRRHLSRLAVRDEPPVEEGKR